MRMASSPAATEAQAAEARRLLSSAPAAVSGEDEAALWGEQVRAPWSEGGTVLRFSWLPVESPCGLARRSRRLQRPRVPRSTAFTGSRDRRRAPSTRRRGRRRHGRDRRSPRAAQTSGTSSSCEQADDSKQQMDVWGPSSGADRRCACPQAQVRSRGYSQRRTRTDLNLTFVNSQLPIANRQRMEIDVQGPDHPSRALIDKCVHCGFCLPTCPTYVLWGEEMDSPRGRIYLMKAGLEGRAEMTTSFVQHFDRCLGCLACVTACPSGVQYATAHREVARPDRASLRATRA